MERPSKLSIALNPLTRSQLSMPELLCSLTKSGNTSPAKLAKVCLTSISVMMSVALQRPSETSPHFNHLSEPSALSPCQWVEQTQSPSSTTTSRISSSLKFPMSPFCTSAMSHLEVPKLDTSSLTVRRNAYPKTQTFGDLSGSTSKTSIARPTHQVQWRNL